MRTLFYAQTYVTTAAKNKDHIIHVASQCKPACPPADLYKIYFNNWVSSSEPHVHEWYISVQIVWVSPTYIYIWYIYIICEVTTLYTHVLLNTQVIFHYAHSKIIFRTIHTACCNVCMLHSIVSHACSIHYHVFMLETSLYSTYWSQVL